MEGKIRQILERVRKGELSPEEAEKLILEAKAKDDEEERSEAQVQLGQIVSRIGEMVSGSIAAVGRAIEDQGKWLEERKEQIEKRLEEEREPVAVALEPEKTKLLLKSEVDAGFLELNAGETELALQGYSLSPVKLATSRGKPFFLKHLPSPEDELILKLKLLAGKAVLTSNRVLSHRLAITMKGAAGEVNLTQASAILGISLKLDASSLRLSLVESAAGCSLTVDATASNLSLVLNESLGLVVQFEARVSSHNLTRAGLKEKGEGVFVRPGEGEPLVVRFVGAASLLRLFDLKDRKSG